MAKSTTAEILTANKAGTSKNNNKSKGRDIKRELLGITFVFLGAFSLLALLSYHHTDPSLLSHSTKLPMNYGGKVGANLAEIMIQFAGLSSFIFSLLCFSFASRLFQGASLASLFGNFFWITLSVLSTAALLSIQVGDITFGGATLPAGGVFGGWIATGLRNYLNYWGATLFTFCVFLAGLVFATPFSAAKLFKWTVTLSIALLAAAWTLTTKGWAAAKVAFHAILESAVVQRTLAKRKIEEDLTKIIAAENKPASKPEIKIENRQTEVIKARADEVIDAEFEDAPAAVEKPAREQKLKIDARAETKAPPKKAKKTEPVHSGNYTLPGFELLEEAPKVTTPVDEEKLAERSRILARTMSEFDIEGDVVAVRPGPVITMFEFKPGIGVKVSSIANLQDDLARALAAPSIRIIAPIPGKDVVGIEIPNERRETVYLREIIDSDEFQDANAGIPLAVGKNIGGTSVITDLTKMPHLLIAGSSGTGKSVYVNSLICSLMYKFTPNEMRMIMVDPKQLELNLYENIPHLLLPVVDDPKKAATALKWACSEMERRYKIMARSGVRHITGFNDRLLKDGTEAMTKLLCPMDENGMPAKGSLSGHFEFDSKGQPRVEKLPFIIIIIDEFADLMMTAKNEVEQSVLRLAGKARAAGIHLVIATQRPSVDVVTGVLKSNLPSRIAFKVASKVDSRTILDGNGAEKLLGNGDMLFIPPGQSVAGRHHGAFVSEQEVTKICDHWRSQGTPVFKEDILIDPEEASANGDMMDGAGDELYEEAINFIREKGSASTSMLQRRFQIGFNRAARMIDALEAQGIVGPAEGSRPREVIY